MTRRPAHQTLLLLAPSDWLLTKMEDYEKRGGVIPERDKEWIARWTNIRGGVAVAFVDRMTDKDWDELGGMVA